LVSEDISEKLKQFIFAHIDSVEQLEVLLIFHRDSGKCWDVQALSNELRANPTSIGKRIASLKTLGLITPQTDPSKYCYHPKTPELAALTDSLAQAYKVRRHRVLELIFSSMKRAKDFADAFKVRKDDN
jgi:hypothetical protein